MRKPHRFFIIIVLLTVLPGCFQSVALAQTFGFRLGSNFANQQFKYNGTSLKPGVIVRSHASVFVNSEVSKNFCIQIEAGFSSVGHQGDNEINLRKGKYNYGVAGVLPKYYLNEKISFLAGPQIGFLLGGKASTGQKISDLPPDRQDLNAVIGVEFYPSQIFGLSLRYNYGITNVKIIPNDYIKQYNRAVQLSFIFRIPGYQLRESGY